MGNAKDGNKSKDWKSATKLLSPMRRTLNDYPRSILEQAQARRKGSTSCISIDNLSTDKGKIQSNLYGNVKQFTKERAWFSEPSGMQMLKGNEVTKISAQTLKLAKIANLDAADATDKMTAA